MRAQLPDGTVVDGTPAEVAEFLTLRTEASAPTAVGLEHLPRREQIMELMRRQPETTLTELAANLGVQRPTVTSHLTALHKAGLVERVRPDGRDGRWRLTACR